MNSQNNSSKSVRQNGGAKQTTHKRDVNLQKNSTLYFQIGLILCLLATYGLLEMDFEQKTINLSDYHATVMEDETYSFNEKLKIYVEEKPVSQKKKVKTQLIDVIDLRKDDDPVLDTKEFITGPEVTDDPPVELKDIHVVDKPDEVAYGILGVERVPIYPGCEDLKDNNARRSCMSEKLTRLIQRKFNTDLANDLGLQGKQVIYTQFKIGKDGNVKDVKVRAPHPALENEAERVINKIPEMTPGLQSNKAVDVMYSLPIVFVVRD